ncbi:uncharacterized protein LOC106658942 isoform X1 [Trichogramma pretiosum]|uniref:uncharacterized protein LOC106658942 isoform X1 n=1 Tax=Trichogramma pretiosum TaxID=7493 RepID=UPI0006C9B849|nr:uncharacterized protein LOC106658942 isoform X1 [Trichogramma pretiosum]XP_023316254.1 uncharacterized protein LOC106658942 isoform X1 [Trichogramma pretiosum]
MSRLCCYSLFCIPPTNRSNVDDSSTTSSQASSNVSSGAGSGTWLCLGSASLALLSLCVVIVAVSTDKWLLTEEKLARLPWTNQQQQQQQNQRKNGNNSENIKLTYSGLWTVCVAYAAETYQEFECSSIDYFPKEEYSPDPSDSTMAIPYAVTKSAVFFLVATALLIAAEFCYLFGLLLRPRTSLYIFTAAVIMIVSGLLMLVGMVMYISIFKAEVGSKLRPRSSFQGPPFVYRYGYSFLLYVSGFITTELAGITAIFLHISWQQLELDREFSKRKCLNHDSYPLNYNYSGHSHNHHHMLMPPLQTHRYYSSMLGYHLCDHHQKRYLYERPIFTESTDLYQHQHQQQMNHHHHHHYHAHNHHNHHNHQHQNMAHLECCEELMSRSHSVTSCNRYHTGMPHDLTTETVSTIADVLQDDCRASTPQHECVSFDLGDNLPPLPETVRSSAWKSNSFKRTTPV